MKLLIPSLLLIALFCVASASVKNSSTSSNKILTDAQRKLREETEKKEITSKNLCPLDYCDSDYLIRSSNEPPDCITMTKLTLLLFFPFQSTTSIFYREKFDQNCH